MELVGTVARPRAQAAETTAEPARGGEKFRSENRGKGPRTKLGAATSGWSGIGVGMENDLAAIAIAIASRAERHASVPRYRAEDLVREAWEAAGPRRAVLARKALALWPDCADGYVLLAQVTSSLEEARELHFVTPSREVGDLGRPR